MTDTLNFHFSIALLLQEADGILTAAEKYAPQINPRLPADFTSQSRTLAGRVAGGDAAQKSSAGDLGTLTQEQNTRLATLQSCMAAARDTAKRAFKGQDVKLREEFQVGVNTPADLASVLQRARIILAALTKADHLVALTAKGWLSMDTEVLSTAIAALDTADNTQEAAKSGKLGVTGSRNRDANALYEQLLTIQNAAALQWPDSNSANATTRAEFRLGKFPPRGGSGKTPPPAPAKPA